MRTRTAIVTALALVALAAPAAQANIPSHHEASWAGTTWLPPVLKKKLKTNPFAARTAKHTINWKD